MVNKHRVKTFVGKTLKGIDGQAGDSSSKGLPIDLKANLPSHMFVRGMVVKDSDLPHLIPNRHLGRLILWEMSLTAHPQSLIHMQPLR